MPMISELLFISARTWPLGVRFNWASVD